MWNQCGDEYFLIVNVTVSAKYNLHQIFEIFLGSRLTQQTQWKDGSKAHSNLVGRGRNSTFGLYCSYDIMITNKFSLSFKRLKLSH